MDGSHKIWSLVIKGQPRWEPGDEIDRMGDSWLFLLWSSDSSPYLTNSMASRLPICLIPASRYAVSQDGVNLTVQAAAEQIKNSFNTMSRTGVKIRDATSVCARRTASRSSLIHKLIYIYIYIYYSLLCTCISFYIYIYINMFVHINIYIYMHTVDR